VSVLAAVPELGGLADFAADGLDLCLDVVLPVSDGGGGGGGSGSAWATSGAGVGAGCAGWAED